MYLPILRPSPTTVVYSFWSFKVKMVFSNVLATVYLVTVLQGLVQQMLKWV